uniref:Nudix hydrolase domain-containing protein n=1 Tax=Haptolina ericina TaxID=156174 RepID=A0A7S3EWQ6_9EUKA|mmetsp:Transcript_31623/g.71449  ORF Transcript_31623/g.71449 Transcript_31623/m.71449 type:complete len:196 (+) Transcript_31623:2-589(+)
MLLISPDGERVFVGKRCVHPQPDWWFVGGRIFPGETAIQSCRRLLKRELGLEIEPARFDTVCAQSLAWGMRQQEPMEHGTTDSQVVLSLQLAPEEVSKVVLDPKEYLDSQWLPPSEILEGHFHPALKFAVQSLLTRRKLKELQTAVATVTDDDALIAKLAREFVAASTQQPPSGESDYKVIAPELQYECGVSVTL